MTKKSPQLRFEGFTDDWEERKLGDYAKYRRGSFPQPYGNKEWYDGEGAMPFVQVVDVTNKLTLVENTKQKISKLAQSKSVFVPKGKVVVTLQGSIGRVAITQYDSFVDRTLLIFEDYEKETDERFWAYTIQKKFEIEKLKAPGGTIKTITKEALSSFDVHLPKFEEQQKIGSFFKQLDETIALHQRKLDLLKEQKKGFLQKMFPKNGEKVPELRFAGFADDWEQRKLGDEVRIVMGQSPNSENYTDDPNDYILVQGNADMKNGRVLPRVWTTQVTKQAEKDDLILSVRAPVGDIGKTAYDVVIGRGVAAIKGNEFIFQNLGKMKSDGYWTRYSTGSTFESINSTDIKEAIISVPAIEEQNKIGSFLKQLDNIIALHQRKCEQTKELKKFMLQKMFPKKGEKNPEIRFPGFTDDWEERKFSDIVVRLNKSSNNNQLPKVEFEDIIAGEGRLNKDISRKFDDRKGTLFEPDNILYGKLRPYLKNWLFSDFKGIALGDFWVFKSINSEPKFVYSLIQADNYQRVANDTSGTKMPRSDWKKVSSSNFSIPTSLEEQQKIGSFFKQLDDTIALHQRKCEQLKELKKFMLQNMFPKKG